MIESTDAGIMVSGRDDVMRFHRLRCAHALALEVNTGLKVSSRASTMNAVKRLINSQKRTKRGVLRDLVEIMVENNGYVVKPGSGVARAMA